MSTKTFLPQRYYKHSDVPLMSGLPLPIDDDGVVRNKHFFQCHFHPDCGGVLFVACDFEKCSGTEHLTIYQYGSGNTIL